MAEKRDKWFIEMDGLVNREWLGRDMGGYIEKHGRQKEKIGPITPAEKYHPSLMALAGLHSSFVSTVSGLRKA